ncbi:hypothetical protein D9611_013446 [Ephemerocybe angulata]|uniref:Secreted protein n=1 Tax=Ephemerocybe angulata TaxID=980116 RepID=A0A8H5BUY7_9AGAR|nr:hypothetical protein D9611_013446 [Tulosesus angulatus]
MPAPEWGYSNKQRVCLGSTVLLILPTTFSSLCSGWPDPSPSTCPAKRLKTSSPSTKASFGRKRHPLVTPQDRMGNSGRLHGADCDNIHHYRSAALPVHSRRKLLV